MAPLIISALFTRPVNPERVPPVFIVKLVFPVVKVPVPVNVPFNTCAEFGSVGLFPKGKLQLEPIVFPPEVILTALKVTLLQDNVAVLPSNVIVPPFALKVGDPEIVNAPAKVIVPLGAVKVPPEIVRELFKSAPVLGRVSVPELIAIGPLDVVVKVE